MKYTVQETKLGKFEVVPQYHSWRSIYEQRADAQRRADCLNTMETYNSTPKRAA